MKKIFSFFVAALMSVSMFAEPVQQDIPLDGANWGWGYSSAVDASGGKLNVTIYSDWGAVATGWDPEIDLSAWDKIVVVVDHMSDCAGEWFKLKAYLRDHSESEPNQLEGQLGLAAVDNVQNEIVINLHQLGASFDITHCRILGVQSEPTGATFTISRVYLEKELSPEPVAKPDTAMGKPAHEEEDVMAIYCNHYTQNNLNYDVQRWDAGISWEVLKLGADSTNVYYTPAMTFEGLASNPIATRDFSSYKHLHFDVWVPDTVWISLTVETATGVKHRCPFHVNAGWNTIDADPAWWDKEGDAYDWKDVKFIIFDQYKKQDSISYEGNPFAFANIYFWNDPAPENIPAEAPAAPTLAESKVMALFSSAYQTRTYNFTAMMNWGNEWIDYAYTDGQHIYHWESFAWGGFGGSEESYALPESPIYDMMHADVYVTVDSKLKFTFEANGGRWKNGAFIDLEANKWNSVTLDLLNAPYDAYDFSDFRYLILEGFEKAEGGSAEGTPLSIGNVYFYSSMDQAVENVEAGKVATKRIIDGKLVIEKNGVRYNAQGTQF